MASPKLIPWLSAYIFQISVDVVGLVDEWAARFFEELDYVAEGENGTLFAEMMKKDLPQVSLKALDLTY
jgi:predicted unusual protein kinase regulating ubiquinone biosynthesis (AarF/ABC1/UbiB family)